MDEANISGKIKKKKGQRGPDREHREFNPKSLSNLKQFQNPISNVNPSTNLVVNSGINWNKLGIITVFVITVGLLIWKIHRREKTDSSPDATI